METNQEFASKMLSVFKNKFEFVLKVSKGIVTTYEVICINKTTRRKEHLYPVDFSGSYLEYLNNFVYPFMLETKDKIRNKFLYSNITRFLDGDYAYSFDADFILNKERMNKKFSFYEFTKDSFLFMVEDNTKSKVEQYLDTLKSIKNCSLLYEVKNDSQCYHIDTISESFCQMVGIEKNDLYQLLAKKHPFDFLNCDDVQKVSSILFGNEKNDFQTTFVINIKNKEISCKCDVSYKLLGKKLYCYIVFNDITDILKLNQLTTELKQTKEKNSNLIEENQTDALTGLGNETKYKRIVQLLEDDIKNGFSDFAVCVCDVNGVKVTNDTYGHQFGCHMIVTAGKTFPVYFKTSDIFHIGGDEYVIIVRGDDYKNLESILNRIRNVLEFQYMEYQGIKLRLSVAIGCSKFNITDTCYHDPFQRADDDMYKRKIAIKTLHGIPLR